MDDFYKLKVLLDEQTVWPANYCFKFIVPNKAEDEMDQLLSDHEIVKKPSKTGKYISYTSNKVFNSSEEIIDVYHRVEKIEGIISL